jgi:heme a synthase
LSRLLFISTKNRWFYRFTLLACLLTFTLMMLGINASLYSAYGFTVEQIELIHRNLTYAVAALVIGLTVTAPIYQKQFSLQPFLIGLILVPLSLSQILLCYLTEAKQATPLLVLLHFLAGAAILSLLWLMGRLTSPQLPPLTHSSTQTLRPWAWLAFLFLVVQIILGVWVTTNFTAACQDFPFCNGQLFPTVNDETLAALTTPLQSTTPEKMTDIHLIHHFGIVLAALYIGLFSLLLLFNRYLYQIAFVMVLLLVAQVGLNVFNLRLPHPQWTIIWYNAVSMLLLLTVITLLTNLYRKSQDYWYG